MGLASLASRVLKGRLPERPLDAPDPGRVGELVCLRRDPPREVVVERLAQLRDLLVAQDADREEVALLLVAPDLLAR